MEIPLPIHDHVAVGERICRELLLVCPDPNAPDYEGRDNERRLNTATRSMINEAMDIIEHQRRLREIQAENADASENGERDVLKAGMSVGEEAAAMRLISRFALAFNGY